VGRIPWMKQSALAGCAVSTRTKDASMLPPRDAKTLPWFLVDGGRT
jgi:hypothetical protein